MSISSNHVPDDGPVPASDEHLVAEWLAQHRPVPSAAMTVRGREVVRNALDARLLRRRAAGLLSSGTLALLLAAVLAMTAG